MIKFANVDAYIREQPTARHRSMLRTIRRVVRKVAPTAEETIAYGIPAFRLRGPLVYFAAFKSHVSLYPAGSVDAFRDRLVGYQTGKGTIQFPLERALPEKLIADIVRFRLRAQEGGPRRAPVRSPRRAPSARRGRGRSTATAGLLHRHASS